MDFPDLPSRLTQVRERIAERQAKRGWRHPVKIVAVTKGWSPAAVYAAVATGLNDIGENRVQEALAKQDAVNDLDVTWHFIGHLQTNKVRHVVHRFGLLHSVDSLHLAEKIGREVQKTGASATVKVLVQVKVTEEPQTFGCVSREVHGLAHRIAAMPGLELRGLMAMAPYTDDPRVQHRVFRRVREARDRLVDEGLTLSELSIGMSADFEIAVEEGATLVRLGTVLFGERPL